MTYIAVIPMILKILFILTFVSKGYVLPTVLRGTFLAAVYEHAVVLPRDTETPVSRQEALSAMMINIRIYEEQTRLARQQVKHFNEQFPQLSIMIIYNSEWSILIKRIGVMSIC